LIARWWSIGKDGSMPFYLPIESVQQYAHIRDWPMEDLLQIQLQLP